MSDWILALVASFGLGIAVGLRIAARRLDQIRW